MHAARNSHAYIVKRLLAADAKPNPQDKKGLTALTSTWDFAGGDEAYKKVYERLLAAGADPEIPDNNGDNFLSQIALDLSALDEGAKNRQFLGDLFALALQQSCIIRLGRSQPSFFTSLPSSTPLMKRELPFIQLNYRV